MRTSPSHASRRETDFHYEHNTDKRVSTTAPIRGFILFRYEGG